MDEVAIRAELIVDYIELCGVVDSQVIYNRFFKIKGANPKTRKDACGRYLTKMFNRNELYRIRKASSLNYLYSVKPFSKTKALSAYEKMAQESGVIYYFEQLGYNCLSIRRNFSIKKGQKLPCVLWLRKAEKDTFFFVEVSNSQRKVERIIDTYNYLLENKIYENYFTLMPILILKTDCKIPETQLEVIRVPYTVKEW